MARQSLTKIQAALARLTSELKRCTYTTYPVREYPEGGHAMARTGLTRYLSISCSVVNERPPPELRGASARHVGHWPVVALAVKAASGASGRLQREGHLQEHGPGSCCPVNVRQLAVLSRHATVVCAQEYNNHDYQPKQ